MKKITVTIELTEEDAKYVANNSLERVICSGPFKKAAAKHDCDAEDYDRLARLASRMWYCFSSECLTNQ